MSTPRLELLNIKNVGKIKSMFANIILSLMNIIFSLSMSMVMYNNGVKKKKHLQPRMTLDLNVIIALYRYDIGRLTNKRPEGT